MSLDAMENDITDSHSNFIDACLRKEKGYAAKLSWRLPL